MKIKRYVRGYLFYALLLLLISAVAAVSVLAVTVKKRDNTIDTVNSQITAARQEIEQIKSQLDEKAKENESLSSKLQQSKEENERLQNENKKYKKEIEKLSAKKQVEVQKSLAKKNSPQSVYPDPDKICYLTFDDGPSDNTLKILKILDKYNAKATFFVVGTAKLEYLPKIQAGGHVIALHSNTHDYPKIYKSTTAFFKDLEKISNKVEKITGTKSMLMRFPGGGGNVVSKRYCKGVMSNLTRQVKIKGYAYFDWNVDSGDAAGNRVPAKTITKNVLKQAKNKNSICVLMHDTSAKSTTVDALPDIIDGLKKMGYSFEGLTQKTYGYHHSVNN